MYRVRAEESSGFLVIKVILKLFIVIIFCLPELDLKFEIWNGYRIAKVGN